MAGITTPVAGDDIEATWGSAVADALNPYGCVLLRTANQSVNDSTDTIITFPSGSVTEVLDTDSFHDTGSNTGRITIPTGGDGWYDIGFDLAFAASATGQRTVSIELNGATAGAGTYIFSRSIAGFATVSNRVAGSVPYLLAAGDYVTLVAWQSSGGALNALGASVPYSVRFWALRKWPT